MEHTPELNTPWIVVIETEPGDFGSLLSRYVAGVQDSLGQWMVRFDDDYGVDQGDVARRIVAAVNFCAGLETATLERVPSVADYCGILAGLEDLAAGRSRPWEEVREELT